ncbi:MAG: LysE family transporter [Cyanobacteria bacterium P01_A01_bin.17]
MHLPSVLLSIAPTVSTPCSSRFMRGACHYSPRASRFDHILFFPLSSIKNSGDYLSAARKLAPPNQARWLGIIGGLFLCYLGVTTFLSKPADKPAEIGRTGLAGAYLSTFGLTLTNPATILSFVLLFAGFAPAELGYGQAVVMVGGVFLGSALWWLLLSSGVSRLRHWLTPKRLVWVNRGFGVLITIFGIVALSWRG